jgi:nicotinamidase-related amidase
MEGRCVSEWTLMGKTALLVIHMQNAICRAPSPLEFMGHCRATEEQGIVPHIADLLAAFRGKGLPVIYLVAYTPDETAFPVYGEFWRGLRESQANKLGTHDVEILDELTPQAGEPVVYNWPFDIFRRTDVERRLRDQGVETVVLVGVATGMAVVTAAYQLADRFFNLIVPADCVTDGNRQLHEAIMDGIMPVLGLVTTADDVIAHLGREAG